MGTTYDIKRLCESWWEDLADATRDEQQSFAERFLHILGWTPPPAPVATETGMGQPTSFSYVLVEGPQKGLVAHFVTPGSLEAPGAMVERGLDYCESTRALASATMAMDVRYCFITDLYRSYLYDTKTDELLMYADTPTDFHCEFGDVLPKSNVLEGALEDARRQPRSYLARQLREWSLRWCDSISAEMRCSDGDPSRAIDRLFVFRFLVDHGMLKRSGWRLQDRYYALLSDIACGRTEGCGKRLNALFHDTWLDWKAEVFAAEPRLDAALQRDHVAVPLLREFGLLSRAKFDILTVLESFNYGEAAEKARVRMIPEDNEDRRAYLARRTVDTIDESRIEVDLSDEGYRAIFYWFDKLVATYERLDIQFDTQTLQEQNASEEMDLFAWSEINEARPDALSDRFRHAVERGLVVYYTSPRQFRTARLMLYLHLITQYGQAGVRFTEFPAVEAALHERPRVLESDRQRIFQHASGDDWDFA